MVNEKTIFNIGIHKKLYELIQKERETCGKGYTFNDVLEMKYGIYDSFDPRKIGQKEEKTPTPEDKTGPKKEMK